MHHKCKAECCSVCPIPKDIWDRNQDKIVRQPTEIIDLGMMPDPYECQKLQHLPLDNSQYKEKSILFSPDDFVNKHFIQPITKDMMCPFLNADYTCNIYDDRPGVCRDFGNETHPDLTCSYQDKDGKERSRQESRKLKRECQRRTEKLINFPRSI
jgi:Fe-S-cluster containining protein